MYFHRYVPGGGRKSVRLTEGNVFRAVTQLTSSSILHIARRSKSTDKLYVALRKAPSLVYTV